MAVSTIQDADLMEPVEVYRETLRETALALACAALRGGQVALSSTFTVADDSTRMAKRLLSNCGIYEPSANPLATVPER